MKTSCTGAFALSLFTLLHLTFVSPAAEIFSEGFDDGLLAKVGQNNGAGGTVTFVDYSNMTVGAATHVIAEAPRQIAGSQATRGVLMKVDYAQTGSTTGNERIVNLIALDAAGGSRLALTDNYRLKFDFYLRLSPAVTLNANNIPSNTGTTEHLIWGTGYTATAAMGRGRLPRGTGTWGHLATEGGFGTGTTGGDAGLWIGSGTTAVITRHLETAGDRTNYFTPAFGATATPVPNCPANQWVEADITVKAGQVTVEYMAVGRTKTKFCENITGPVAGTVMVGYEDVFGSTSFAPDDQWMLLDNLVVEDAPPPTMVVTASAATTLRTYTGTPIVAAWDIRNTRTTGDLTITGVQFSGTNAADFSLVGSLPMVVAAGTTQPLPFAFIPAAPNGVKTVNFTIVSDDPERPNLVLSDVRARRSVGTFFEAHYKLDEASGPALADSSGFGSAGALIVRQAVKFGQPSLLGAEDTGKAMGFLPVGQDGTSGNYFTAAVVHTPTFSISLWIKPASTGGLRALFQRDYDSLSPYDKIYGLHLLNNGTLAWNVGTHTTSVIPASGDPALPTLANDAIHHIVLTHLDEDGFGNNTASRTRLYLNGRLIAEKTGVNAKGFDDYPIAPIIGNLHIASRTIAGHGYSGDMDDIQIYGAELTREQIWQIYKSASSPASQEWNILSAQYGPGLFSANFLTSPDGVYTLHRSSDLQVWDLVGDGIAGPDDALSATLKDEAPPAGAQYYRIMRE